ncbi:ATP-dependent nuclease [Clavibacter michiganensis]|uniref:ATP-dependent nuclease n=1 Tax=Clavibacter michiganensis TaxID=28447 RepID=UPI0026DA95F7|nr:TOPRIM nucleotidyl transferase/hydrolase domain-containing protein [Clavibacter michiganensis]MDO4143327.1 AAA family ATPase [Clavibacter michiganensis]
MTVSIEGISDADLERVPTLDHRERVAEMAVDGALTLVRRMPVDGKVELAYLAFVPKDEALSLESINAAIAGKTGASLRSAAVEAIPELENYLEPRTSLTAIRQARETLVSALPAGELKTELASIKTGIPASINAMLPEVIYIEAVKDATSETKTSESTSFGKLIKLLLGEVSSDFVDIVKQFEDIQKKLSRVADETGLYRDERLAPVKLVEKTIEAYVLESFPGISLKMDVPAPTLGALLTGALLRIDDGHEGPLASKGDGLKRTVLFAILRAYSTLRSSGLATAPDGVEPAFSGKHDSSNTASPESSLTEAVPDGVAAGATSPKTSDQVGSYLLLFEEPELYLHPRAQRQLMATLADFAQDHPVLVTTHSPSFFGPTNTGFAKLEKLEGAVRVYPVELDMSDRDAYQLVRHKNNEAAFFAKTVVLVEGDSDTFTLPHLAKILHGKWDHTERNVMYVQTGGKGSISRYRDFFATFGVNVHVITDLDALVQGFDKLTNTPALHAEHSALMEHVVKLDSEITSAKSGKVKDIVETRNARQLWIDAQERMATLSQRPEAEEVGALREILAELFDLSRGSSRLAVLAGEQAGVVGARDALVEGLRNEDVYVLSLGDLESYMGKGKLASGKVTHAIKFCADITSLSMYEERLGEQSAAVLHELRAIFERIYAN